MKNKPIRFLSLLLALCLLFSLPAGAEGLFSPFADLFQNSNVSGFPVTAYSEMEYTRPDLGRMESLLEEACRLAEGKDVSAILNAVFDFYDEYDWFYTAGALANIRYSADLTDTYWEQENEFCTAAGPTVEQMLDSLYTALAQSPCRRGLEWRYFGDGFFDGYDEEGFWDEELVELMEQENQLINRYYSQCQQMSSFWGSLFFRPDQAAQTLADLIVLRNRIAAYVGYDSYEAFANDYYYYRDYTPEALSDYLQRIQDTLVPLYLSAWETVEELEECSPSQALDFVRQAAEAMGGTVWEAFQLMDQAGLYDIEAGPHKYDSSFELYLYSYQEPFLFMNPEGTAYDCLTLAHEFGHFCNDYASFGTVAGVDVSEVFSQSFEYLSLLYHPEAQALVRYKMADSLSIYVEQACYARFEQEMYRLSDPTPEALCDLYSSVAAAYGLKDEYFSPWDFVTVPHFYTNPMYIPSYIVSNDAAMQLYQLECDSPGQALTLFEVNLDTQQPYFMAFLEEAGLESPFAPGRLEDVVETFRAFFSAA